MSGISEKGRAGLVWRAGGGFRGDRIDNSGRGRAARGPKPGTRCVICRVATDMTFLQVV